MSRMKEIKYIFKIQILVISILLGITLGSTIQEKEIIYKDSALKLSMPEEVYSKALKHKGTLYADYSFDKQAWFYIDKTGQPCRLFEEVK